MSKLDVSEIANLRKLALGATKGEWFPFIGASSATFAIGIKGKSVDQVIAWGGFDGCHEPKTKQKANCEFIAAVQPLAILRLLDELEDLKLQLANCESKIESSE